MISGILLRVINTFLNRLPNSDRLTIGYSKEEEIYPQILVENIQINSNQTKLGLGVYEGTFSIIVVDQSLSPLKTIEIARDVFGLLNNNRDLYTEAVALDLKIHSLRLESETLEFIRSLENSFFVNTLDYKVVASLCN